MPESFISLSGVPSVDAIGLNSMIYTTQISWRSFSNPSPSSLKNNNSVTPVKDIKLTESKNLSLNNELDL